MFDGIDARFGYGGFQILNTLFFETHQLSDGSGGAHGYLLVAEARRQPDFYAGGFPLDHRSILVYCSRHRANAVISSPWRAPSANSSMAVHNAWRISSALLNGQPQNTFRSLSSPNSSSPRKTSVRPSV